MKTVKKKMLIPRTIRLQDRTIIILIFTTLNATYCMSQSIFGYDSRREALDNRFSP